MIHRPGEERSDDYIELVSDKIINLFVAGTEKVLYLWIPQMLKALCARISGFSGISRQGSSIRSHTSYLCLPRVLSTFKEYYASVVSIEEEPIIFTVEDMLCRADTDRLVG